MLIVLSVAAFVVVLVFFIRPAVIRSEQAKAGQLLERTRLLGLRQAVGIYVDSQHEDPGLTRLNSRNWIPVLARRGLVDGDLVHKFESGNAFPYAFGPGHLGTLSTAKIRVYHTPESDAQTVLVRFDDGRVREVPKREFNDLLASQNAEWPGWDHEPPSGSEVYP